jgi:hypothetical protein
MASVVETFPSYHLREDKLREYIESLFPEDANVSVAVRTFMSGLPYLYVSDCC